MPKGFKLKTYKLPDEKYVVVVHPWGCGPRVNTQSRINNVVAWFQRMLQEAYPEASQRDISVFYQGTHDNVIVQLPAEVDIRTILGAHHASEFNHPSDPLVSYVYEYNWKHKGDPMNTQWQFGTATYEEIHPNFPIKSPYPRPRVAPNPSVPYALPLPKDLFLQSNDASRPSSPAAGDSRRIATPGEQSTSGGPDTSGFTPYQPPANFNRQPPPPAKFKHDPDDEEKEAVEYLNIKHEDGSYVKEEDVKPKLEEVDTSRASSQRSAAVPVKSEPGGSYLEAMLASIVKHENAERQESLRSPTLESRGSSRPAKSEVPEDDASSFLQSVLSTLTKQEESESRVSSVALQGTGSKAPSPAFKPEPDDGKGPHLQTLLRQLTKQEERESRISSVAPADAGSKASSSAFKPEPDDEKGSDLQTLLRQLEAQARGTPSGSQPPQVSRHASTADPSVKREPTIERTTDPRRRPPETESRDPRIRARMGKSALCASRRPASRPSAAEKRAREEENQMGAKRVKTER